MSLKDQTGQWHILPGKNAIVNEAYLRKLEAVASAAQAVVSEAVAREILRYGVEDDHSDWVVEMDMMELTWEALCDALIELGEEVLE